MTHSIPHIISLVKTAMGLRHMPKPLIHAPDAHIADLDSRMACRIEQTARDVYESTPPALLMSEAKTFHHRGVYWHEPKGHIYSGHVLLPDDFMLLAVFEMSDWKRPVFLAMNGDAPEYAVTRSRFPGICGNADRPVAAIVNMPEGRALEFHSCMSDTAYISKASYIAWPTVDGHGGIEIADNCLPAVIQKLSEIP